MLSGSDLLTNLRKTAGKSIGVSVCTVCVSECIVYLFTGEQEAGAQPLVVIVELLFLVGGQMVVVTHNR